MAQPVCEECRTIYRELLHLLERSRQSKPGPGASPQQLAAWFDEREFDDDYRLQVRPAVSEVKRRLVEHCRLTGHSMVWPPQQDGTSGRN